MYLDLCYYTAVEYSDAPIQEIFVITETLLVYKMDPKLEQSHENVLQFQRDVF